MRVIFFDDFTRIILIITRDVAISALFEVFVSTVMGFHMNVH